MSTNGWIERQRLTSRLKGGGALLSWKGHVEWFTKRRTAAVIWLMREANGALCQSTRIDLAFAFLCKRARVAHAYTFLLDIAFRGKRKEDIKVKAKTFLVRKSLHARRYHIIRNEAHQFLLAFGKEALELEVEMGNRKSKRRAQIANSRALSAVQRTKAKCGLNQIHMIYHMQRQALEYLRNISSHALNHCDHQSVAFMSLQSYGKKTVDLVVKRCKAQEELVNFAEKARNYGCKLDQCWGWLILYGEKALTISLKQETAAIWLHGRASRAGSTAMKKQRALAYLRKRGAMRLCVLQSAAYLQRRVKNSILLLYNQDAAVCFLQERVLRARKHTALQSEVQMQLRKIGTRGLSKSHLRSLHAYELAIYGHRAKEHFRSQIIAGYDLRLHSRLTLLHIFKATWTFDSENSKRFGDEVARMKAKDTKVAKERKAWLAESKDKEYMREAFIWLATLAAPGDQRIHVGEALISR